MKKILYYCFALAALLPSCSSDIENSSIVNNVHSGNVVLSAEDYVFEDGTRTSLTNKNSVISFAWSDGETIGVFPVAPTTNCQAMQTVKADGESLVAEFNGAGWALLQGNTYAAYSPFDWDAMACTTYSDVRVFMDYQTQVGNANLDHIGESYDYMYAKATVPTDGGTVNFAFKHIGAIIMLQLSMPEDAEWDCVTLMSKESVFTTACHMNVSDGTLKGEFLSKSMRLDLEDVAGKDLTLYMIVLPCETGDMKLTVTSTTGKEYIAELAGKTLQAGRAYRWTASPRGKTVHEGEVPSSVQTVDLGLPSGLKWANMNVGATSVSGYGHYFAWGEVTGCQCVSEDECVPAVMDEYYDTWGFVTNDNYVEGAPKSDYGSWDYYKWYNGGSRYVYYKYKYVHSSKSVLDKDDDAANYNWGDGWRMPTDSEMDELVKNCYWAWTDNYDGTGVAGRIAYKAKSDVDKGVYRSEASNNYTLSDTHIFLPAAGCRGSSSFGTAGICGYYWSARQCGDYEMSCDLRFSESFVRTYSCEANFGMPVRAVHE